MNWLKNKFSKRGANGVKTGLIGLEFALESLNMVQLEFNSSGVVSVRSWISKPYPQDRESLLSSSELKSFVRSALKAGKFQGNKAVSVLPSDKQKILAVNYQLEKGQTDEDTIIKLLENRLPGHLSEYVIDYLPVRSTVNEEKRHAVVVAASEQEVLSYLGRMKKAGIDINSLEVGPAAIKRLVGCMSPPSEGVNVLVINFGARYSYLTMISGRRLLFDEQVEYGEEYALREIANSIEMPVEQVRRLIAQFDSKEHGNSQRLSEEWHQEIKDTLREIMLTQFRPMVEEVNRTLVYAASETHGEPVKHIYILGSIARWRGAAQILSELLGMQVELIPDPLCLFAQNVVHKATKGVPEIAVATGLALRGMEPYGRD